MEGNSQKQINYAEVLIREALSDLDDRVAYAPKAMDTDQLIQSIGVLSNIDFDVHAGTVIGICKNKVYLYSKDTDEYQSFLEISTSESDGDRAVMIDYFNIGSEIDRVQSTLYLSKRVKKALKYASGRAGIDMSAIANFAIYDHLYKRGFIQ